MFRDNICRHVRITNTIGQTEWVAISQIRPLYYSEKLVDHPRYKGNIHGWFDKLNKKADKFFYDQNEKNRSMQGS